MPIWALDAEHLGKQVNRIKKWSEQNGTYIEVADPCSTAVPAEPSPRSGRTRSISEWPSFGAAVPFDFGLRSTLRTKGLKRAPLGAERTLERCFWLKSGDRPTA
jgi:hypothetical protein